MLIAWIIAGVALVNNLFWLFRVSAFRKDRVWDRGASMFGAPLTRSWDLLNSSSYLPEGQFAFRCFAVSQLLAIATVLVAFWLSQ